MGGKPVKYESPDGLWGWNPICRVSPNVSKAHFTACCLPESQYHSPSCDLQYQWHYFTDPNLLLQVNKSKANQSQFPFCLFRSLKWASAIKVIVNSLSNSHANNKSLGSWRCVEGINESILGKDSSAWWIHSEQGLIVWWIHTRIMPALTSSFITLYNIQSEV